MTYRVSALIRFLFNLMELPQPGGKIAFVRSFLLYRLVCPYVDNKLTETYVMIFNVDLCELLP